MKKIVLIDDHELVRIGLRSVLEGHEDFSVVGEASGRREALDLIAEAQPDLAIVDLVLGNDDGVSFIRECRALHPNLQILVITIQDESIYAERVIRAGADGFLSKEQAAEKLLEAVETVFAGELFLSRKSTSRILGRVLREPTPHGVNPITTLSDRELFVFQMIGTGLSTNDIAESLGRSRKTVETFREKIKMKLDFKNARELRESARMWVNDGRIGPCSSQVPCDESSG